MKTIRRYTTISASLITLVFAAPSAFAQTDNERIEELEAKAAEMATALAELRAELDAAKQSGSLADLQVIRSDVVNATQSAQRAEKAAGEWKNTTSVVHLAGYAAAGYTSEENGTDAFDVANFNPIFHFQYGDRILWESEVEVEIGENGETEVSLEYSSIDVFLNDNLVLVAGKFISPLGNFRQNLHPSWINKLPSAPPGFGHGGAAPLAEVGVQLRGAIRIGDQQRRFTYAGYIGNGPFLEGEDGEVHGIDTEGYTGDADDEKIIGGRLAFFPLPKLELGVSGAFGDAAVVENDEMEFAGDPSRAYEVIGVDAAYQWDNFDFRGEYIQQDIADEETSVAPEGGRWETWYVQAAYKFANAKWEGVLRYADYQSPHADQSQEQWVAGVNYLLSPSAIVKLGFEFNDGLTGERTDNDRWLIQIAYGY